MSKRFKEILFSIAVTTCLACSRKSFVVNADRSPLLIKGRTTLVRDPQLHYRDTAFRVSRGGAIVQKKSKNSQTHASDKPEVSSYPLGGFEGSNSTAFTAQIPNFELDSSFSEVNAEEYKTAMVKTCITVAAAGTFGLFLMTTRGLSTGYEFFAGYLIEQSLSIDNLFVFIMLFEYFKIPLHLQSRVLSWGITGAIVLRGLMIAVGVTAIQKFKSVILVFAGILIASSINLLLEKEHESDKASDNFIMKMSKSLFPNTSSELHGESFFVIADGKRLATPLLLCLICVELSDFIFAVDSIPAVLGVTKDPLVVYASNIFAIMALRSLYTVMAKAVSSFVYLKPAVALVLGFVGSKMIAEYFHIEIGTGTSLAVIVSLLTSGVVASMIENQRHELHFTTEGNPFANMTFVA